MENLDDAVDVLLMDQDWLNSAAETLALAPKAVGNGERRMSGGAAALPSRVDASDDQPTVVPDDAEDVSGHAMITDPRLSQAAEYRARRADRNTWA